MSFARLLQPLSNVIGLASSLGPKSIVTQTIRFLSSKPTKDTPKRSSFHFADYKAKPSPLAGVGDVYKTQLVRKKVLADPSKPTFDKIECLKWAKWRMLRDVRRRHVFVDYWATRDALENVRKCKILPASVREAAFEEHAFQLPRDSRFHHLRNRCAITGRGRGLVKRYRLSRLVWRDLADNNRLSGVARALW